LGGFAFIFHALKTLNYKKELVIIQSNSAIINKEVPTDLKEMSRPIMLTGSYSIIIGLWFILKIAILIYGSRDSNIMGYIELFILTTLISFASGLCPITLTSRNISLSSKIRKRKEREKVALYHSKMKARASDRRR
tara:strand:- start:1164 stop:1571 length:408 start_codon:yes stop_codon:yes gene_type:complete